MLKRLIGDWVERGKWFAETGMLVWGVVGVATMSAVHHYWPQYSDLIITGLLGFVAFFTFAGVRKISKFVTERSLPSNLSNLIRDWADKNAEAVSVIKNNQRFEFGFVLKMHGNVNVGVTRERGASSLAIGGSLEVKPDLLELIQRMTPAESHRIIVELRLEMTRLNMTWAGFENPPQKLMVERYLPITNDLTEYQFSTEVRMVQNAMVLLRQLITLRAGVIPGQQLTSPPVKRAVE